MDSKKSNDNISNLANLIIEKIISILLNDNYKQFFNNRIEWMTTKEAANHLKISENNLRVKVSRGQIQVHGRLGKCWRFRRDKLDKLLNGPDQGLFND
jgi:excisionase family DNA binding protein